LDRHTFHEFFPLQIILNNRHPELIEIGPMLPKMLIRAAHIQQLLRLTSAAGAGSSAGIAGDDGSSGGNADRFLVDLQGYCGQKTQEHFLSLLLIRSF